MVATIDSEQFRVVGRLAFAFRGGDDLAVALLTGVLLFTRRGLMAFVSSGTQLWLARFNNSAARNDRTVPGGNFMWGGRILAPSPGGKRIYVSAHLFNRGLGGVPGNSADMGLLAYDVAGQLNYVGPASAVRGQTVTLSARLTDANGLPAEGQVLRFTLEGFDATAATGPDGVATVDMPVTQAYGLHALHVSFAGDDEDGLALARTSAVFTTLWEHVFETGHPHFRVNTATGEWEFRYSGYQSPVVPDPSMRVETCGGEPVIKFEYTDVGLSVAARLFLNDHSVAAVASTPRGPYVFNADRLQSCT